MKRIVLLTLALGLFAFAVATTHSAPARPKTGRPATVVLELFTSQGCSSCPPADRLLSTLGRETFDGRTVIPLAYHVDYWNSIGWRDPFSSASWSNRQRRYAQVIKGSQVYTPQLVINGSDELVGSSEYNVRAEIGRQLDGGDRGVVSIERVARNGNALAVDLRAHLDKDASPRRASVVVALFESGLTTNVTAGENASHTLANDFIVRFESSAGEVHADGNERMATLTIPLDPAWRADHLGIAAFLQDPQTLAIYGSAVKR